MRYMGGKSRIAKQLAGRFNQAIMVYNIDTYIEPFVGGASVIELVNCRNRIGNDLNHYQIALLEKIRDEGPDSLPDVITRENYYDVKYNKDKHPDWYVAYVGIVGSFNCVWFDGYGGLYKTKDGKEINSCISFKNRLKATNEQSLLSGITLKCGDYRDLEIPKGSLVYCDPPYKGTAEYKDKGFNHKDFYDWVIETAKDSLVFISEYRMPKEFKLVDYFHFGRNLSTNCDTDDAGRTDCLFVVKDGWLINDMFGEYDINIL